MDDICRIYTRSRFLSTLPREAVCNVYYSCPQYSMAPMANPFNKKLFWVLVNTQKSNAFRIVRIAGLCLLHVLCWQTQKKKKGYCNYVCFFIQSAIHVKVQDDKSSLLLVVSSIFIIIVVCGLWCVNRRFLSRHLWSIQIKMKLFQWQRLFFLK